MLMINRLLMATVFSIVAIQACCVRAWAQTSTKVEGSVKSQDGSGLPGVNVVLKGTTAGTTTDSEGTFAINVPGEEAVLVFSFIGYETQEVRVGTATRLD